MSSSGIKDALAGDIEHGSQSERDHKETRMSPLGESETTRLDSTVPAPLWRPRMGEKWMDDSIFGMGPSTQARGRGASAQGRQRTQKKGESRNGEGMEARERGMCVAEALLR